MKSPNSRRRSSIYDVTSVDNGTTSTGHRGVSAERSEAAQVESRDDPSSTQTQISNGQISCKGGVEVTSNGTSKQDSILAQTTGLTQAGLIGDTSIHQMHLDVQPTVMTTRYSTRYTSAIEFTRNRVFQRLPTSGQMIGLAKPELCELTSILQMLSSAQSTEFSTLAPLHYADINLTSPRTSVQVPVFAQTFGPAGCYPFEPTPFSTSPTVAASVSRAYFNYGIEWTSYRQSQQLPVSAPVIGRSGIGLAGSTALAPIPWTLRQSLMAVVGPTDYHDGIGFNTHRTYPQPQIPAEIIGFGLGDFAEGMSMLQMPLNARPSSVPAVGRIGYTEGFELNAGMASQQPPFFAQVMASCGVDFAERDPARIARVGQLGRPDSIGFNINRACQYLPIRAPVVGVSGKDFAEGTSIPQMPVEMPASVHCTTAMPPGVTQTPYGLFIPNPPLKNLASMTYPMHDRSDQN